MAAVTVGLHSVQFEELMSSERYLSCTINKNLNRNQINLTNEREKTR